MKEHDITEQAFKNGYSKGYEAGLAITGKWISVEDSIRVLEWFERFLQRQPIADVVPRSEVEELQKLLEVYKDGCGEISITENGGVAGLSTMVVGSQVKYLPKEFTMLLKQAKQDVAREIFEEIEKLKHTKFDWNDYVEWEAIDELRKKYIGESK